ncbi:helix-turn-helix transcriptional regulator [Thalassococcus sp. S3]|uniref:helix-turn-helix transcriptional regulator n=1 Tax=Thalassococcus sp. S3 TaxID=2017482 RepID=UPI001024522D|nr:helix-turn-helix transcriptional regulator [Thalassococcus sp. S3]QBF30858.1 AraC family transcriptional regulator [Thalassococcus sp. S3]
MPRRYQDVFPSLPLLDSDGLLHQSATALMTVRYFQADPGRMPEDVFAEHHVLLNLRDAPHRVQNTRNGQLRDFTFHRNEIIVTPAGTRSGWRWFDRSDVIVITLDPGPVARFAEHELGMLLSDRQLADLPQFSDADIVSAGVMLRDSLEMEAATSPVMFEALARVFLVKLLQRYGDRHPEEIARSAKFTSAHYRRVLDFVKTRLDQTIAVEDLAREVGMSPAHFSRVFKEVMGKAPMQYVMAYRIEQSIGMMSDPALPLGEIALACGFADQAHFSRSFKQLMGTSPSKYRATSV